jgi:hypothetical protein
MIAETVEVGSLSLKGPVEPEACLRMQYRDVRIERGTEDLKRAVHQDAVLSGTIAAVY